MIDFWSNFGHFLSNWGDFSEKVRFAIKNRDFWVIFVTNFDQILVFFDTFFGSFLGFLGGYPSPSISAPLVVKKCLKLYIYNIGVGYLTPYYVSTIATGPNHDNSKYHFYIRGKNTGGRTRIIKNATLWILPDMNLTGD